MDGPTHHGHLYIYEKGDDTGYARKDQKSYAGQQTEFESHGKGQSQRDDAHLAGGQNLAGIGLHVHHSLVKSAAVLFPAAGIVHQFGIHDFAHVNDGLSAVRTGFAVVGNAGVAVGAVHEGNPRQAEVLNTMVLTLIILSALARGKGRGNCYKV